MFKYGSTLVYNLSALFVWGNFSGVIDRSLKAVTDWFLDPSFLINGFYMGLSLVTFVMDALLSIFVGNSYTVLIYKSPKTL